MLPVSDRQPMKYPQNKMGNDLGTIYLRLLYVTYIYILNCNTIIRKHISQEILFPFLFLINKKLYIINIYNLMNLEINKHPWTHHHNLCHKTYPSPPEVSSNSLTSPPPFSSFFSSSSFFYHNY